MRTESWLAWLATCMALALSTRNPLYLGLLLLINAVAMGPAWKPAQLLRLAPIVAIAAVFNALTVHLGDTLLFEIPDVIPLIRGPVTLEAAIYGALNGLVLVVVMSVFNTFSHVAEPYDLIRMMPRAFFSIGVTIGIALNFVPQTARRFDDVKEAMAIRGIVARGLRDWLPLWIPLLAGGLESAGRMADALMARGYGEPSAEDARPRAVVAAGLVGVVAGWLMRFAEPQSAAGAALMLAGVVVVLGGFWLAGRSSTRTLLELQPFGRLDVLTFAGCAIVVCVALLPFPAEALVQARATLEYQPYPAIGAPSFSPLLGLAMLGLTAPALRRPSGAS